MQGQSRAYRFLIDGRFAPDAKSAFNFIEAFPKRMKQELGKKREPYALMVQKKIRSLFTDEVKTGKTGYIPPGRSNPYTMSAPGQAPAYRTGELSDSIKYYLTGGTDFHIGSDLIYARALELGYGPLAPRPYIRRAFREMTIPGIFFYTPVMNDIAKRYKGYTS